MLRLRYSKLLPRAVSITLCLLLCISVLGAPFSTAAASEVSYLDGRAPSPLSADTESKQVVLILAPFLRWEDITQDTTPYLWEATEEGAIGALNARSRVKEADGKPSLAEGALTISSGAWPFVDEQALPAFQATEYLGNTIISTAYKRYLDGNMAEYKIAYLGLPRIVQANVQNPFELVPGTLGTLIEDAGGVTVAIGNSDLGYSSDASRLLRPAAIVAMNEQGMVAFGNISEDMLEKDPESPFGVRTDVEAAREELAAAKDVLPAGKPGLIVIDPGDGYRARTFAPDASLQVAENQWAYALGVLDGLYHDAQTEFSDATIIVASQASRSWELNREGFGPIIVTGPGIEPSVLTSQSTHRPGLVISSDITTTILRVMELEKPVSAIGTELVMDFDSPPFPHPGDSGGFPELRAERLALLIKMNNTAIAIEATRANVINTTVGAIVAVLLAGAITIIFADRYWSALTVRGIKTLLYVLILGIFCIPPASLLMFLIYRWPATPVQATSQFVIAFAVLWGLAMAVWLVARFVGKNRNRNIRLPLIVMSAVTALLILIDQLVGAPLSFTGFFSYSPIAAFRFYGIGNEGVSVLIGAVLTGLGLALDASNDSGYRRVAKHLRLWGIPLIGGLTIFISTSPLFGANNGASICSVIAFGLFWMLANDKRLTWPRALAILAVGAALLASMILVDRFSGNQTHLARALGSAQSGGLDQLWIIITRKAAINMRVLTQTNFTYIVVALLGYLAYMRARPSGEFARMVKANPHFGSAITATLAGGVVAYFSNDSGIVLPALMVLYLSAAMVWLMLGPVKGKGEEGGSASISGDTPTGAEARVH